MALPHELIAWTKQVFLPLGPVGLFLLAFIESSFFPIPPDVLLIPLVLATPENWFMLGLITTIGSVLGAVAGYYIGMRGGRPVMEKMVSEKNLNRVERYYDEYGILAVGIAGFTPVPYKVFTITAGTFRMDFRGFVAVSLVSRGARFFLEATILGLYGKEVVSLLENYFGPITLVLAVGIAVAYFIYKEFI